MINSFEELVGSLGQRGIEVRFTPLFDQEVGYLFAARMVNREFGNKLSDRTKVTSARNDRRGISYKIGWRLTVLLR